MKIWVIGRDYPTISNRQWGSFELEQAKMLAKYGNEVSYLALTLSFFSRHDPRGFRYFKDGDVSVFTYSQLYFPGKFGFHIERFEDNCWKRFFSFVEKEKELPDIIHIHYPTMQSSINEIEKYRKLGIKIIVTEHWSRVLNCELTSFEKTRLSYYTTKANTFICVSRPLANAVKKQVDVRAPLIVIPNMVSDCFNLDKVRPKTDAFQFIAVGQLIESKQLDIVIRAFSKSFSDNKGVTLTIVGDGKEKKKLLKLKNKLTASDRIHFTGILSRLETAEVVRNSNALICFSRYETFGVPIVEALYAGKPVVISNSVGFSDFWDESLGIMISTHDETALSDSLLQLYNNYTNYSDRTIHEYAAKYFSENSVYERLMSAYS